MYYQELEIFNLSHINVYNHIDIDDFSILLKNCCILIGNSSSGIREACVFGTPVINIGTRQQYRLLDTLENVHNMINFDKNDLINKITLLEETLYKSNLIFGQGDASYKIINILKKINYRNSEKVISYSNVTMN